MESITSETIAAFRAAAAEVRAVLGAEQLLNATLLRVGPPYTVERWNPHAQGTAGEWEPVPEPPSRGAEPVPQPPRPPVLVVEGTVAARDQLAAALHRRGIAFTLDTAADDDLGRGRCVDCGHLAATVVEPDYPSDLRQPPLLGTIALCSRCMDARCMDARRAAARRGAMDC
jgi:hypothetical protein